MELLAAVAGLTTSLILLASGLSHARRPVRAELAAHGVLPRRAVPVVVVALPVVELLAGLGGTVTVRGPALAAQAVLFAAFAGYLGLVVRAVGRSGRAGIPCGCGLPEIPVGAAAVARAAVLALLALLAAVASAGLPADAAGLALVCVAAPTLALLIAVVPAARRLPTSMGVAS